MREELLRSAATGETVRAAAGVTDGGRELVDTVRYHLRDIMSPHFLGALFHSDEKDGTLLRATNAMRAASLWDGMAELSDSQIWTALAGANGTAERKPVWGDSIELGPGTTLRTGGCCSSPLWSQAECCTDGCCRKCDRWSSVSFYEALYAAQPDAEVNMLKRQWQDGGGLHFNAAMGAEFIPGARNLALALALALTLTLTLTLMSLKAHRKIVSIEHE